jgi:choline dehydrogenase-like flavoprotein
VDNRYISPDTWYDAETAKAFQPQVHYFVGGATKLYGAALYRLRAEDFGELRHHDGISPAWPIGYDVMEPYYTEAEQLYQVHGARGEDPTEPPASAPYPHPAVSHEPRIQQLADDLAAAGHQPFHAPCGVMLDEGNMPYSNCVRCSTCDGFPCLVHAKSDAEVLGVRPALEHPNVTLMTGAKAVALRTNPAGSAVTEVVIERHGVEETLAADIVVVSCGAANSAKLLLASASDKHPNGLANGSDQVGRNYTFHNSQAVPRPERLLLRKRRLRVPAGQHPDGRQVAGGDVPRREAAGDQARADADPREHGPARRRLLAVESKKRLYHKLRSLLGELGMHSNHLVPRHAYLKTDIPVAGVAHQAGTCRFGTDPAESVLNEDCRAHELDNLYVVDTSFFPSIGAVNPALTAMANALRVGDHLLGRLGAPRSEREPAHAA